MANYCAVCRSNYFKVKDVEKFKEWCIGLNIEVDHSQEDPEQVVLFCNDMDGEGWPKHRLNTETDELVEIDLMRELAAHLQPGWVAILMEVGSEKLRYLNGWAGAVNSEGQVKAVNLDEIYDRAKSLGAHVTEVEY